MINFHIKICFEDLCDIVIITLKQQDLTTLLKYLRGSDFTERHWREVYSLLEMEYKKPDTLQVKDFLAIAVNIKKQIKALQVCSI